MKTTYLKTGLLLIAAAMFVAPKVFGDTYSNTNFQSDIPGVAQHTDPNLVNPWGMVVSSGGTIWVSDNGTGVSTLYNQAGIAQSLVVEIPRAARNRDTANPTGVVFTRPEIEAVSALCREHDLWLLSDEVYEDLAFARPHIGAWSLPGMAEQAVVVSSLSKSHALPAFRLGWVVGPPVLARHLSNLLLCLTYGSPAFIQHGALTALRQDLPEVAALREDYRARAAMLSGFLADAPGCRLTPPEGGMFVLLDVRGTGLGAADFAHRLLDRERVAVLPCDGFGPSAAGHLRIALSAPEARLRDAGSRILRFAGEIAARPQRAATP